MKLFKKQIICIWDYFNSPVGVVSYPKAGRTWLRLMMSLSLSGKEIDEAVEITKLTRFSLKYPTIIFQHDDFLNPSQSFKTHKFSKTILLIRDPRDVVVSSYFEHTLRSGGYSCEKSLSDFLRDDRFGINNIINYYNIAYKKLEEPRIVRYEDLKSDPVQHIRSILKFLGIKNVSKQSILDAVEKTEFKKMQRSAIESTNQRLKPSDVDNPESQKMRRGKIGGYVDYLNDEDTAYAAEAMKDLNKVFGY